MRIADAKMEQKAKVQRAQAEEERKVLEEKDKTNRQALAQTEGENKLKEFQTQIAQDLDDIYKANMLPRPAKFEEVNNESTTDDAAKETQKLLKFGVELNTRLAKEGKPPVASLAKIYFLHYQPYLKANPPTTEVAGGDAPVSGTKNAPTGEDPNKVNYAQLHKETWAQTTARVAREYARKALNK